MEKDFKKELLSFYRKEYRIKTGGCLDCDVIGTDKSIRTPSLREIEDAVCEVFGCSAEEISSFRDSSGRKSMALSYFNYIASEYYSSRVVAVYKNTVASTIRHRNLKFSAALPDNHSRIIKQIKNKL